ncbi:MAG: DNA polymerase II large subunit, partial [Halobacteriales archaeon]|nr:DNA polymerase II large subunit [Halobacteriales archaeon]
MGADSVQVPAEAPPAPPAPPVPPASAPVQAGAPTAVPAQPEGPAMSPEMRAYFESLHAETMRCYAIAKQARRKGKDPNLEVEIPPAEDLAARVEAQVGPPGVAKRIRQLSAELGFGSREVVSLQVATEVADDLAKSGQREKALDQAVRTGLSILTEGVLVAPLEGIAEVKVGANLDGTDYVDLYFAGPIRAAGGTAQAMAVLIADLVRRKLGIGVYKATDGEVERYKEEIAAYKMEAHLQYNPTGAEIELIARNCPVCINGEGTEREEVTGNRDLPRVETNQLRGGACLVMAEGMILKAPKVLKHVEKLKLEGWDFLNQFLKKGKGDEAQHDADGRPLIAPKNTYVKDLIAGRPVFGHPSRPGAFRLRYGRARTSGLAANAFHPATMAILDDFLAVGTQLKVERPGKGTLATACDQLEGPAALLKNGSLVRFTSIAQVKELRPAIAEIVDLGEILIPFGEFAENNANLPQSSWVREWWRLEHEKALGAMPAVAREGLPDVGQMDGPTMVRLAEATGVALHPDATLLWHDLDLLQIRALGEWAKANGAWAEETLWLPADEPAPKDLLVKLLAIHRVEGDRLHVEPLLAYPLLRCLGLDADGDRIIDTERRRILYDPCQPDLPTRFPTVALVSRLAGFPVMPKAPCRIGGRMGRPEKADARKMKPPPHGLFPLGSAGGIQRLVKDAAEQGTIQVEVGERACQACGRVQWRSFCECGGHTVLRARPVKQQGFQGEKPLTDINLRAELERAKQALKLDRLPETIKGVIGVINADKVPEPLEKALLRARHDIYTFKDGTVRFDMIDVPLTHFRPKEVGLSVARAVELGYTHDMDGRPLERDDQLLELRVQDLVLNDGCGDYLLRTAKYLDELLERFYGLKPYYNAQTRKDLVGHLTIGLAPHTSGGVLSRIIGYTRAQCHFAHPYFHAAKRRNCLHPATELYVLNSPQPRRTTLADLYAAAPGAEEPLDGAGTLGKRLEGLRVLAADPATGVLEPRQALRILKVPSPRHLLEVRTAMGRSFTCSPGHRVETLEGGRLVKRKAVELVPGVRIPIAGSLRLEAEATDALDLLAELAADPPEGLVVRGLGDWLRSLIGDLGGLSRAAAAAGVSSKDLDNQRRRDSVRWETLAALLQVSHKSLGDVPRTARLAVRRDTVELPRLLRLSPEFLRLIGYYLAEGHARSVPGQFHQVDIAASEPAAVADVLRCAEASLGLSPTPQPTRVTLSGRLVHLLFMEVLGLGSHARAKRIPARLACLPLPLARELLRGYFSGDGSVEDGRLHVTCDSVSPGLLRDIGLQLARWGVAYRLSTSERPGGGAVRDFYARKGQEAPSFTCHRLSIRSNHAAKFAREVGFALERKQAALEAALPKARKSRIEAWPGDLLADEVVSVQHVPAGVDWLHDLEVDGHHNFLVNDHVLTSNCDGDEDAILLLMDGLVNFSRAYVPDRRGGLMDLPLVLSTRLDPNEVDKEAHNLDTLRRYPLEFYHATTRHAHPKEVAKQMGLVEARIGKPSQYEGLGFTHDTKDINEAPAQTAYKTLTTMMDKMTAQMELARKIRAVDEADVGARVIGTHLLPDLMGNLKSFSKQKIRCPKCNAKFRRMPLKGSCLTCGNENLTLTVHEGSVRKYLEISKQVAIKYKIDPYTHQRILLLEQAVESLFTNDKVK